MYFLGVDSARYATRAVIVDLESALIVASETVAHAFVPGLPQGHLEQDPAMWIGSVDKAVRCCLDQIGHRRSDVMAMSIGAQSKGVVLLDEENQIVRPAKVSGDISARDQLNQLNREFGGPPGLSELLGNAVELDSPAARLLWFKQREPFNFEQAVTVMQPHDFLNYWLTGVRAAEVGNASRSGMFDVRAGEWSSAITNFIDPRLHEMLLPLQGGGSMIGSVRLEVAQSWGLKHEMLVSAGSGHVMMAALGSGSSHTGTAVMDLSTSEAVWGVSEQPLIDPRSEVRAWCDATHQWLAHFEEERAASSIEMIEQHYGWSPCELEHIAAEAPVGAQGLKSLPLGYGTRNAGGEGMFHGITAENFTPSNMARASLEGLAVGLGYGYHRMGELGLEFQNICVTGHGVQSAQWRQLVADVCGVPSYSLQTHEGASLGAAIHAAVTYFQQAGESLSFSEMAAHVVTADETTWCQPDPERHQFYLHQLSRQQYLAETLIGAGFLV
ncbi:MAG: xylulokinase [Akkermansiaceae bacterium]